MIRTYIINRNELDGIKYTEDMLSEDRRSKISGFKREEDAKRSACAELALIYALGQSEQISLPLPVEKDERSKLFIPGQPLFFNISHAGDYAACVVCDRPVGIDIEYFRVKEVLHADRMLHPEEAATMAYISNPNEKKKFFYECWVSKESYLKNLGIGLMVHPRDFLVHEDRLKILDNDYSRLKGHHGISFSAALEGRAKKGDTTLQENLSLLEKRYVHVYEPGEVRGTDWKFDASYRMAVCSMEKDPDNRAMLIRAQDINEVLAKTLQEN